jgi:hypothetical protein
MLDESAPEIRRRRQSAGSVRYREERRAMVPFRKQIGELQCRVAFAIAMAGSSKTAAHGAVEAEFASIRSKAVALLAKIDGLAAGSDVGPAEDCRRALQVLTERLDDMAP